MGTPVANDRTTFEARELGLGKTPLRGFDAAVGKWALAGEVLEAVRFGDGEEPNPPASGAAPPAFRLRRLRAVLTNGICVSDGAKTCRERVFMDSAGGGW